MKEPKLRFLADDGSSFPDLKEKRLNDVCKYNKGQSIGVNYVGTENMKQDFSGVNDLDSEKEVKGVAYNIGDTLMSNIRPYLKKTWKADVNGVCSTDVLVFHPTDINSDYLYRSISSEKFISYVMTAAKGSKMPRGDKEHIMNYDVQVPCLSEQQKIASLFTELDILIQSAEKELEGYRELKQGMLQKMFPKKGETVPEIRFPEFSGDWKQSKLKEVTQIIGGNAWKSSDYSENGEYLVVTIANVSGDKNINDSIGNHISVNNTGTYLLNEGDILVSLTGNVGRVSRMTNTPALLNQRVGKMLPNEDRINPNFLFHVLRNSNFEKAMIEAGQGAAQKNISNNDVLNYAFYLPTKQEQHHISAFLDELDSIIEFQQQDLDGYKELKKGLLQQMFC